MGSGRARPSWFFLPWNATTAHSPSRVGRQGRTCVHWPVSLNVSGAACAVVPGQAVGDGGLPGGHPPSPWVCPQGPYIFLVYAAYNGEVSPGTQAAAGVGCGWGWVGLTCRGLCTQPVGVGEGSQPCPCPILQVRSALRRMTEKKAAEAFTVGRPGGQGAGGPTSGRDPSGDAPPFRLAPVPRARGSTLDPRVPGRWPGMTPESWLHPRDTWLLEVRPQPPSSPSATRCPSLPSAQPKHLKDKETGPGSPVAAGPGGGL